MCTSQLDSVDSNTINTKLRVRVKSERIKFQLAILISDTPRRKRHILRCFFLTLQFRVLV